MYIYFRNIYIDYLVYYIMAGIEVVRKDNKGKVKQKYEKKDGKVITKFDDNDEQ